MWVAWLLRELVVQNPESYAARITFPHLPTLPLGTHPSALYTKPGVEDCLRHVGTEGAAYWAILARCSPRTVEDES